MLAALGAYLACLYAIAPWQGLRFKPASDVEFSGAGSPAMAAAIVCCWRILLGSTAHEELLRLGDAIANSNAGADASR